MARLFIPTVKNCEAKNLSHQTFFKFFVSVPDSIGRRNILKKHPK